jgi:hypothetical protein
MFKRSALSATLLGLLTQLPNQTQAAMMDNGTPQCEYAHNQLITSLKAADDAHADFESADRLMNIAYKKADWNSCRNCKSKYKKNWDKVKANDKAF